MVDSLPIHDADKDFWEEQLAMLRQSSFDWAMSADQLIRAYDSLAASAEADGRELNVFMQQLSDWRFGTPRPACVIPPRLGGVVRMLGGYAIEAMLKGIALGRPEIQAAVQAENKGISDKLFNHKLREIAELAEFGLTAEETVLCERLEQFTTWAGRYPAPQKVTGLLPRKSPDSSVLPLTWGTDADYAAIRVLIDRLRQALPSIDSGQPWDGEESYEHE